MKGNDDLKLSLIIGLALVEGLFLFICLGLFIGGKILGN